MHRQHRLAGRESSQTVDPDVVGPARWKTRLYSRNQDGIGARGEDGESPEVEGRFTVDEHRIVAAIDLDVLEVRRLRHGEVHVDVDGRCRAGARTEELPEANEAALRGRASNREGMGCDVGRPYRNFPTGKEQNARRIVNGDIRHVGSGRAEDRAAANAAEVRNRALEGIGRVAHASWIGTEVLDNSYKGRCNQDWSSHNRNNVLRDENAVVLVRHNQWTAWKITLHLTEVASRGRRIAVLPLVDQLAQLGVDDLHGLIGDGQRRAVGWTHAKDRTSHAGEVARRHAVRLENLYPEHRLV